MYHIFFIHFPEDGHLGCFLVLAVVNRAAVNIGVHVSFYMYPCSLDLIHAPGVGLQGHMVSSTFNF